VKPRVSLLDVNVLIALFDPDHPHHEIAHDWFADDRAAGWATCAITENGLIRVLSNPSYAGTVRRPVDLLDRLGRFCASGHHVFWDMSVSLRDEGLFVLQSVATSRQLTDVYLLGLATQMRGRLVTFDQTIPLGAVVGATRDHLAVITPSPD
jgi:toxin-antitoxin system PIN domain toxin